MLTQRWREDRRFIGELADLLNSFVGKCSTTVMVRHQSRHFCDVVDYNRSVRNTTTTTFTSELAIPSLLLPLIYSTHLISLPISRLTFCCKYVINRKLQSEGLPRKRPRHYRLLFFFRPARGGCLLPKAFTPSSIVGPGSKGF
jgi:hypothetical protein